MLDLIKRLDELGWTLEEFKEDVASRKWWHPFDFGQVVTPGQAKNAHKKWLEMSMPDLTNKTLLDVGTFDGYFAFMSEQAGAKVTASDYHAWHSKVHPDAKRNFHLVHTLLDSRIEIIEKRVEDLDPLVDGTYDIVLFLGVLYHAPDPLGYLTKMAGLTNIGGMCVVETHMDLIDVPIPAVAYYPNRMLAGGPTFWGPNEAAVSGMCLDAGFTKVDFLGYLTHGRTDVGGLEREIPRGIFHAYKEK